MERVDAMTRKDYVKFAEMLARVRLQAQDKHVEFNYGINRMQVEIADIFASDNPRFDRERFYEACEPKGK